MKSKKLIALVVGLALMLLVACAAPAAPTPATPTPAPPVKPPVKVVLFGVTGGIKSYSYVLDATISDSIRKAVGLELKPEPLGGAVAGFAALKKGSHPFIDTSASNSLSALHCLGSFAEAGWEPMRDLRLVWTTTCSWASTGVRADSDIKTLKDIKGKRIGWCRGNDCNRVTSHAIVAFAGYSWDDVIKVDTASYFGGIMAVKDGSADFSVCSVSSSAAYEVAGSPHGLRWLSMPPEDEEGWKRFYDSIPFRGYVTIWCPKGVGAGLEKEGLWGYGAPHGFLTLVSQDPELVYTLAKGMTLAYKDYRDLHSNAFQMSLRYNVDLASIHPEFPFHEGTVRWLTEVGVWTPELEEEQSKRLEAMGATK